jgi:hypothetical protein
VSGLKLKTPFAPISKSEWPKFAALLGWALLVFAILLFVLFLFPSSNANPFSEVAIRVLTAMGGALLTSITVQRFVASLEEDKKPKETAEFVASLFLANDGSVFDNITDETRGEILRNVLKAHTKGQAADYGKELGDDLVRGYFGENKTYREQFSYDIDYDPFDPEVLKSAPASLGTLVAGIKSRAADYHWITQSVAFVQHGTLAQGEEQKHSVVQIALDDAALGKMWNDPRLIFREEIQLLPEDEQIVRDLTDEQLGDFVRDVLRLSARISPLPGTQPAKEDIAEKEIEKGKEGDDPSRKYSVAWKKRSGSKCIEIRVENPPDTAAGLGVHLMFAYPNRRSVTHFVAVAPRPVKGAAITVSATKTMNRLSYFPFVSQFGEPPFTEQHDPHKIKITSKPGRWWFPTSGFVFLWDPEVIEAPPPKPTTPKPRKTAAS